MNKKKNISKGTALITGGAIRIGKAIALTLAKTGYDIALHYNSSAKEAKKTAAEINKLGRKCFLFQCDLSNASEVSNLIKKVQRKAKNLNLLINSASIFEEYTFQETTENIFDRHMNINFKAPFFLTQQFAKICMSGQVINLLDTYITKTMRKHFIYLITKKALNEFTRMAARELAPDIRVNAIAIGTTTLAANQSKEYLRRKAASLPMKRLVEMDDITNVILNLISNEFVTGQCVFVDGGEELI